MDEIEQALFAILVDHDVAIAGRNGQRTPQMWPDLSDIHTETRRRIREVFGMDATELRVWLQAVRDDA